jgi:glutamate/tyrosine decarboxylase-like PLP-dependent enzyme
MLSRLLTISNILLNTADDSIKRVINSALNQIQPSTLIATTAETILLTQREYQLITYLTATLATTLQIRDAMQLYRNWNTKKIIGNFLDTATLTALQLPHVGPKVENLIINEVKKLLGPIKDKTDKTREELGITAIEKLPYTGMRPDEIRQRFKSLQKYHKKGTNSGSVYTEFDEELLNLLKDIFGETALTNPMHSTWPLINEMEAEVFSICKNLFDGAEDTHGIMTHGGTGSIIEACNAYVQYARNVLGIKDPEIIAPESIHVAFDDKTRKLLNAKLILVPVDPITGKADVAKMEAAITHYTVLMVGSAPCFSYGCIDPIQDLAKVAKKHGIYLHVDACLGGFLFPFANKTKYRLPDCNLSVDGVNSISADIHKFGLGPKGISVALFRDKSLFSPTPTYTNLKWHGGLYVTPGYLDGSRSGAVAALALAVLLYYGEKKYIEITEKILSTTQDLTERLKKIDGITVPFHPDLSVIYIQTRPGINHHLVAEKFEEADATRNKQGWSVNDMAHGFHFCITAEHTKNPRFINDFVDDLTDAIKYVIKNPSEKTKGLAKAYKYIDTGLLPPIIQSLVGDIYQRILKTLPGKPISSFWKLPVNNISMENTVGSPHNRNSIKK